MIRQFTQGTVAEIENDIACRLEYLSQNEITGDGNEVKTAQVEKRNR